MPLGIEYNSTIPQMIQGNSAALVQGIRQIGQQISGHLTELQTKRDLGGLAMEMQGVNPASTEFPVQLTQLVAKHPLAARDERGQMLLGILGKAHGQWQASQADALAFERQMKMLGLREEAMTKRATAAEEARRGRPVSVPGVGLVQPNELDPVTGQPKVLIGTPPPAAFRSSPQGVFDARTGLDPQGNPLPAGPAVKPMTEYQRAQLRRAERKDKISAINQEINQFDSNIASGERAYEAAFKREMDARAEEKKRHEDDKTKIGKDTDALKAEKAKRLELLRKLREEDEVDAAIPAEEEIAAGEGDLGLPPLGANAAAPITRPVPVKTRADVEKLPKGTPYINPADGRILIRK